MIKGFRDLNPKTLKKKQAKCLTICFGGLLGSGMASAEEKARVMAGSAKGDPGGGHVSKGPTP